MRLIVAVTATPRTILGIVLMLDAQGNGRNPQISRTSMKVPQFLRAMLSDGKSWQDLA